MKASLFVFAILVCCVAANVVQLTPDNFDSEIDGSVPALIKFFAPWCGHCKKMAPDYELLGKTLKNKKGNVIVAEVDCDQHKELCQKYDVSGYPTLKWFATADEIEPYSKGRTAPDMLQFIKEKTGISARLPGTASSRVVTLNEGNFEKMVLQNEKDVFVKFYAPWCGHCKTLAPVYNDLADFFQTEDVVIAEVDCDSTPDLCQDHGVTGYPTLKWFGEEKEESTKYTGARDIEGLVEFCNFKLGTKRTADGTLDSSAGLIEDFAPLVERFNADKNSVTTDEIEAIANAQGTRMAKVYKVVFKRILENADYVTTETDRLNRMIEGGSLTAVKVDEFTMRKNILAQFA